MRRLFVLFLLPQACVGQDAFPQALIATMKSARPDLQLVQPNEINLDSCGADTKTAIQGDFNGDGLDDYAALFRSIVGETRVFEQGNSPYTRTLYEVLLVAFLSDESGLRHQVVNTSADYDLDFIAGLETQPREVIREFGGGAEVELTNEAILRYYCEKSATVFYWRDGAFHELWTAD